MAYAVRTFDAAPPNFHLVTEENIVGAADFFASWGFVIVRVIDKPQCESLIREQWTTIIRTQPWTEKIRVFGPRADIDLDLALALPDAHGNCAQRDLLMDVLIHRLSGTQRKEFARAWPLHRGFGACCDNAAFHLPGVWALRQDERLYKLACAITGTDDLWVDVNRSIQKLPGEGEQEFLHFDCNPLSPAHDNRDHDAGAAGAAGAEGSAGSAGSAGSEHEQPQLCGKVCYTPSRVVLVPNTHTKEFRAAFKRLYAEHYPKVKPNAAKVALCKEKPDPLGLVQKAVQFPVPAGCAVFWSKWLLHGMAKTPLNEPTEYGCYLGYFKAGSRQRYEDVCGVTERADRVESYLLGQAPKLWPSFDAVHFVPKRFTNFPKILAGYIAKMPENHPSIVTNSKGVTCLRPWPNVGYTPPALSALGRRLLGISSEEYARAARAARAHPQHDPESAPEPDAAPSRKRPR